MKFNLKFKTKFSIDSYIEFSSVLALFLQGAYTQDYAIDLKLFYFVIIINSILLYSKHNIKLHKYLFLSLLFVVMHAVLSYSICSISWVLWIKQVVGISFFAIYYYNVFSLFNIEKLFKIYLRLSVFFCILAIVLFQFDFLLQSSERLDGLMSEPSVYVYLNIPALFYFIKSKNWVPALLLLVSFVLAQSSIGFISIIVMLLFLIIRKSTIKYLGFSIIPLLILFFYVKNNEYFKPRFDSVIENLKVYETNKIREGVNISSFVLIKSSYIVYQNFIEHPLGTGIGSFEHQHDIYLKGLEMPKFIRILKIYELNKFDANSLFLRGLSDFGVFWIVFVFFICWLGFYANSIKYNNETQKSICISAFIYILIYLIRGGHYFPEEMFFFVFMFFFNLPKFKFVKKQNTLNTKPL
jgi:hypothetical protein|tara:strand:+ start:1992 stop:3221 length:1230 start_codon:yes stop_codon:yes gene_type:complete